MVWYVWWNIDDQHDNTTPRLTNPSLRTQAPAVRVDSGSMLLVWYGIYMNVMENWPKSMCKGVKCFDKPPGLPAGHDSLACDVVSIVMTLPQPCEKRVESQG